MLPMEKGRYRAKAVSWQLGEASTGTPQVGIEFAIEDGEHKGERISGYFALSDAAVDYTLDKLKNSGITWNDAGELVADPTTGLKLVELVVEPEEVRKDGQPVIDDRTGEVRQRLKIQFVNRAGGLAMKAGLSEDKKRILAAKMREKLRAIDAKEKKDAPVPAPSGPAVQNDIPF